jgi:hypothetical protein
MTRSFTLYFLGLSLCAVCVAPLTVRANSDVEAAVRAAFADTPVLIEIARCESNFRHLTDSGSLLRNNRNIGVMQLHSEYHGPAAAQQGLDITKLDDHLLYAALLYAAQGTTPWRSSAACWQGREVAAATPATAPSSRPTVTVNRDGVATTSVTVVLSREVIVRQQLVTLLTEIVRLYSELIKLQAGGTR